ncbi:MAG: Abi family protein [Pseudomonadota bacterium]
MTVEDKPLARHWLHHVSYYRLSAYWLPFENGKDQKGPRFQSGTTFEQIIELYEFDRHLRLLVMDALERIEVALRGSWAYALAHSGGPHGYLNAALYQRRKDFHENFARLARQVGTSPETYIEHYRENYDTPAMPPVWMVAETLSFGQLSRWYSSLNKRSLRTQIAMPFGLSETIMVPLLKHLSIVRNSCAHHARLWNRGFLIRMKLPEKHSELRTTLEPIKQGRPALLYNSLVLMRYLVLQAEPDSEWHLKVKSLLESVPTIDQGAMGFPSDWEKRALWQ